LSPPRPQTTIAIEKEKMAAREAQPRVISTEVVLSESLVDGINRALNIREVVLGISMTS